MDVLILLLFVSLVLVAGALILFFKGLHEGDFEHGDRLSLLPLREDAPVPGETGSGVSPPAGDVRPSETGEERA